MRRITERHNPVCILGAGMTGLAAGLASGFPVYEAEKTTGGICSSYYMRPREKKRLQAKPKDEAAYRFEIGGGHWIFGADPLVLRLIRSISPIKSYSRKASIYLPNQELLVPYPLQNHLGYLGSELASKALQEMEATSLCNNQKVETMADWLHLNFGPTLCGLFFDPFHRLYTAGLCKRIAPQDAYKSPVDIRLVRQGASAQVPPVGYNATYIYPEGGLDVLAREMAARSEIYYDHRVESIDVERKEVHFTEARPISYDRLLSTLPLNRMLQLTGLKTEQKPNPSPSVLVLNMGATKGPETPQDHWVYIPNSQAQFHRVGFYSNVDSSYLPATAHTTENRVSVYVEKAFPQGQKPTAFEIEGLGHAVVKELQDWGWISDVEVLDPTWIDVAYTWSWPNSKWKDEALKLLDQHDILQVGRYARWVFQGIADSIRDGLIAGTTLRVEA